MILLVAWKDMRREQLSDEHCVKLMAAKMGEMRVQSSDKGSVKSTEAKREKRRENSLE